MSSALSVSFANTLRNAYEAVQPSSPSLKKWHDEYYHSHCIRLAFDLELCAKHCAPASRILEVGSIPLLLTHSLKQAGYAISGVDVDPSRYSDAIVRTGLTVAQCDIEREALPFPDEQFDCVLLNEVFEHLRINLIHTASELSRVLKPDGLLFVSTPNLRSYRGLKNLLFHGKAFAICAEPFHEFSKLKAIGHMGHIREYTPVEVMSFMRHFGMVAEKVIFRGEPASWGERIANMITPSSRPFFTLIMRRQKA